MELQWILADEAATLAAGKRLANCCAPGLVIYLEGDLGAGKTTFCRGFLHGFGHRGAVKSPTYTLVEPYELGDIHIYHFDLYRLGDAEELEYMGIREYFDAASLCLIEWPARGQGVLPSADLVVSISQQGVGRCLTLRADSGSGQHILAQLSHYESE